MSFKEAFLMKNVIPYAISHGFIKLAFYGIYYWLPTYLQEELGYDKTEAGDITSLGSIGGILGSIILTTGSDLMLLRGPVHFMGCGIGALCLCFVLSVHDMNHSALLTFLLTSFNFFVDGASVVISLILIDISKEAVRKSKGKSISTISGIVDGIGGMGSILGQLLIGPV